MSNVLIGIIGVILFIGLALAGALILGSDFLTAGNESRAAASVSQMAQVSNAIQMYKMKTGTTFSAGTPLSTLVPCFLKSLPNNPTTGPLPETYTADIVNSGGRTSLVLMELGTRAEAVCQAIASQSGQETIPVANDVASVPNGASGCFRTSAAVGSTKNATYYAFNRTWGPSTASAGGANPTTTCNMIMGDLMAGGMGSPVTTTLPPYGGATPGPYIASASSFCGANGARACTLNFSTGLVTAYRTGNYIIASTGNPGIAAGSCS